MSYLTETRYHYFSLDSDRDLSAAPLTLSTDNGTTWTAAEHVAAPDGEPPAALEGLTRYWWRALFGPALPLKVLSTEQVVLGSVVVAPETISAQWTIYSTPTATADPCGWPLDPACLSDEWDNYSADVQRRAGMLASATLRRLTGYRVGNCPVTVRPSRGCGWCFVPNTNGWDQFGHSFSPGMDASGGWVNNCGGSCYCQSDPRAVSLPAPAYSIVEVKVNGAVINPANYSLVSNHLYWTGTGTQPWLTQQDVFRADTEANTFSVTYMNSYPVDALGSYAAGVLAMEYASACTSGVCRLPSGVTNIVRQGISMEIASGAFPGGLTGIREVDSYLAIWNPGGLTRPSTVWVP